MERSQLGHALPCRAIPLALVAGILVSSTGCLHQVLATGVYILQGGNMVAADCNALEGKRVVVICRPPASNEYRHAGAAQSIARRISETLASNVKGIDVVDPREVDNWIDESDWGDFTELARAVKADMVVHVEMDHFDLFKGKTLYQGNADVTVNVHDMNEKGKLVWERHLGEVLYPVNSGIPAQDKPVQHFQSDFEKVLAAQIAEHFYKHEAHSHFAQDALANR
jgi:hypothetical protein